MGVFDAVINDVGSQLGISSNSAGSVLSGLLSFIGHEDGGVGAFLDRFRRAGVGNLVSSWLGGETKAVSTDAVESALGRDAVGSIASRAGVSFSTAVSAIALMLPKLVARLAPGGAIPTRLAPDMASYVSGPTAAAAAGARQAVAYSADTVAETRGLATWLWPLLALLLIGGLLAYWLANRRPVSVPRVAFNVEDQVRVASQRASAALSALGPGFTAQDLVGALNLGVVNFTTGSAQVPADSHDYLNRAATAIKNAPSGTTIEVGGHTDNTGTAAANMQLSQQRADAVRAYLMQQGVNGTVLTAKGYGDTRPTASNDTDEGRFKNRRIEFSAQ